MRYFYSSIIVSILGIIGGAWVGYSYSGTIPGMLTTVFLVLVLSVLEVSLSFDNAVVNATVLEKMTPVWRHRFLTWGILIAVFGMRLVFPLLIVCIVAAMGPIEALKLIVSSPTEYERIMTSVHAEVAAFGGSFLMLVALKYFFNAEKDVHWIHVIEQPLSRMGKMEAIEIALVLLALFAIQRYLPPEHGTSFLVAGIFGVVTFVAVDGISAFLHVPDDVTMSAGRASAGMFLYLEVLDASFSFDGVIGAFAISNNLFVIMIGLGIGAMFVRSLTIMLVEKKTLNEYRYLEHGAFYAIAALATIMFLNTFMHIPEVATGLIGATFIGFSLFSSLRHNKRVKN